MANRFARKTGNWNASDVWSDTPSGVASAEFIPGPGDVAMSNNFTITVNISVTCTEVRSDTTGGATAGGFFDLASGVTLTANCYAGSVSAITRFNVASPAVAYIIGNIFGGTGGHGVNNASTGTINVTGNITGGGSSSYYFGAVNNSSGIFNLTGNATGGTGTAYGAVNNVSGVFNLTGNVFGSATTLGADNASTGTFNITGMAVAGIGSNIYGARNIGIGTLIVGKAVGNAFGAGSIGISAAPGVSGLSTNLTKVKSIQYGERGQTPTVGNVFIEPDNDNQATFIKSDLSTLTLSRTDGTDFGNPTANNVRHGIVYALGNLTGTCYVPLPQQVSYGVPVDNTIGTAQINVSVQTAVSDSMYQLTLLSSTTLSNQNISTPHLIYTYTADITREIIFEVLSSGLSGNNNYTLCHTKQIGGVGTAYQSDVVGKYLNSQTTFLQLTTPVIVNSGDVLRLYTQGSLTDTATSIIVKVYDSAQDIPSAVRSAIRPAMEIQ